MDIISFPSSPPSSTHTGSSTVSTSFGFLREAEMKLKDLVRTKFQQAADSGDIQGVERLASEFNLFSTCQCGTCRTTRSMVFRCIQTMNSCVQL